MGETAGSHLTEREGRAGVVSSAGDGGQGLVHKWFREDRGQFFYHKRQEGFPDPFNCLKKV